MSGQTYTISQRLAAHYRDKYGDEAINVLQETANMFERNGDPHSRNKLLRIKDEISFLETV